jgi:hypothetical protein
MQEHADLQTGLPAPNDSNAWRHFRSLLPLRITWIPRNNEPSQHGDVTKFKTKISVILGENLPIKLNVEGIGN